MPALRRPGRALAALAGVLAAAGLLPARASAHGGATAPVATSFVARLTKIPQGLEARVVDGDQRLWLRVRQGLAVVVLGFQGEPYLRFSPAGVDVNERSPAYYLNRTRPRAVPPGLDAPSQEPPQTPSYPRFVIG